jgi:CBS domain containing-hemolysin-like protein
VEQLVGDIDEAAPTRSKPVRRLGPGRWDVDAAADLSLLEKALRASLPAGKWRTVAGMVIGVAGRLPRVGDRVEVPGFTFRVTAATRRRVVRVEATASPASPAHPEDHP